MIYIKFGPRNSHRPLLAFLSQKRRIKSADRSDPFNIILAVFLPLSVVIVTPLLLQSIQHLLILHVYAPFIGQSDIGVEGAGSLCVIFAQVGVDLE